MAHLRFWLAGPPAAVFYATLATVLPLHRNIRTDRRQFAVASAAGKAVDRGGVLSCRTTWRIIQVTAPDNFAFGAISICC
jgi:hypothetical protein